MKFKVGDTVTAYGLVGKVSDIDYTRLFGLLVEWPGCCEERFTHDGKLALYHKDPVLKLIKQKKDFSGWVNIRPINESSKMILNTLHNTKEQALYHAPPGYQTVEVTGQYEIEV